MADLVDLVVIGYPDETTAEKAYEVVLQLEHDLVLQVAGAAVVVKHGDGGLRWSPRPGRRGRAPVASTLANVRVIELPGQGHMPRAPRPSCERAPSPASSSRWSPGDELGSTVALPLPL